MLTVRAVVCQAVSAATTIVFTVIIANSRDTSREIAQSGMLDRDFKLERVRVVNLRVSLQFLRSNLLTAFLSVRTIADAVPDTRASTARFPVEHSTVSNAKYS